MNDSVPVPWTGTWCPQCGPDVSCDEDGSCSACGATAVGEGAEQALALRAGVDPTHPGYRKEPEIDVRLVCATCGEVAPAASSDAAAARTWGGLQMEIIRPE